MRFAVGSALVIALVAPALACAALFGGPGDYGPRDSGVADTSNGPNDAAAPTDAAPSCDNDGGEYPFCVDFDKGPLLQGWTTQILDDGGSLALWTAHFVTPPSSLLAQGISPEAGSEQAVVRTFASPAQTSTFALDFDMWIDRAEGANAVAAFIEFQTNGSSLYRIEVALDRSTGLFVAEYDDVNYGVVPLEQALPLPHSSWVHVRAVADLVASTITVSTGGLTAKGRLGAGQISVLRRPPILMLGLPYVEPGGDWSVAFDNVRFVAE